jgi:hypothetical protein
MGVIAYSSVPLGATQGLVNKAPPSAKAKSSEVIVDGRPRRGVVGQKPLLTATFEYVVEYVEDGV